MRQKILTVIAIFLIGMAGGIFSSQFFLPYLNINQQEPGPVYLTETKQVYIQENVALVNAAEKAGKTVVGVKTQTQSGKILEGSGLIVTSDGLMVTLAELVPFGSKFSFFVDDKTVSFQILKRDLNENLALVKISDSALATSGFASLEKLKIGERVFLVGAVFEKETPSKLVNEGIVKAFDENLIQTNIFESHLLAGSPLFNIEGEILGINTIDSAGRVNTIPVSKIRAFVGM